MMSLRGVRGVVPPEPAEPQASAWTSDSWTAPSQAYTSNALHCGSSGCSRPHCSSNSSVTPSRTPSARRTSFSALSQDKAWSWVSWMRPPSSGSVSSIPRAADHRLQGGQLGVFARSGVVVVLGLDQRHDLADEAAQQRRLGGGEPGPRTAAADRPERFHVGWLLVLLHRGPQAVAVQYLDVVLHRFPGPGGDHRLALVVHVEHQLGGLLLRVAENVLEHVCDVGHQVDRIVPDDRDPGVI